MEAVRCPHCQSEVVVKYGTATTGKARYRCQQAGPCGRTFIRASAYPGRTPALKGPRGERTLKGSGIRDIARVLQVRPTTVSRELKQRRGRSVALHQAVVQVAL